MAFPVLDWAWLVISHPAPPTSAPRPEISNRSCWLRRWWLL
jgi:hypothetical protein